MRFAAAMEATRRPRLQATSSAWTYTLVVPQTGDENVRINLWLTDGNAPTDTNEVDVVLRSFQFMQLGLPQAVALPNMIRLPGGQARFEITGQFDRRYQVETSTNLSAWQTFATLVATNPLLSVVDTNVVAFA